MKCRNCKNNTLLDDGEQFSWCKIRGDNLGIDEERFCGAFSQATNADRIRAMNDEELVNFLYKAREIYIIFDERAWFKWLKQESKE